MPDSPFYHETLQHFNNVEFWDGFDGVLNPFYYASLYLNNCFSRLYKEEIGNLHTSRHEIFKLIESGVCNIDEIFKGKKDILILSDLFSFQYRIISALDRCVNQILESKFQHLYNDTQVDIAVNSYPLSIKLEILALSSRKKTQEKLSKIHKGLVSFDINNDSKITDYRHYLADKPLDMESIYSLKGYIERQIEDGFSLGYIINQNNISKHISNFSSSQTERDDKWLVVHTVFSFLAFCEVGVVINALIKDYKREYTAPSPEA